MKVPCKKKKKKVKTKVNQKSWREREKKKKGFVKLAERGEEALDNLGLEGNMGLGILQYSHNLNDNVITEN